MAELLGRDDLKVISCHLGGSSSICAMEAGESRSTSMGMTPQSGVPQNNRVGDFDPFALRLVRRLSGRDYDTLLDELASQGGLLGISGVSNDARDIEEAAESGNEQADLALRVYSADIKRYVGQFLAVLNGADAIVFTGGIGENSQRVRRDVCANMDYVGLKLAEDSRVQSPGDGGELLNGEQRISTNDSKIQVWVVPTNEEIVVARQTVRRVSSVQSPE
jgi:acetate kinase